MRIVFILLGILISVMSIKSNHLYKEVDDKIYAMYVNDFEDYLYLDNNYNLSIDKDRFKEEMKSDLYEIVIIDDCNFKFKIKFNYFIMYEKEYYFYLEKSNE